MVTRKGVPRSRLGDVPPDRVFWCHDGRVVRNLAELASALREMAPEIFSHHVTPDRNDFSNWIRDVIGDVTLAGDLQKTSSPAVAAHKVETRIAWLKARL